MENSPTVETLHPVGKLRDAVERERLAIKLQKLAMSAVRQARYTAGLDLPTFDIVAKHFDDHVQGRIAVDAATRERLITDALTASLNRIRSAYH